MTVRITCLDHPGASMNGRLADLSAHGLSLIVSSELPSGSAVRVEWGKTSFVGEMVYCQPRGEEFLIGLKVDDSVYDASKPAQSAEQR